MFTIATCEGWSAYMTNAWDAVGIDKEPIRNKNKWWSIFYIAHFFIGNLMVFNTFIGVLIEKFTYIKNTKGKYKGLSVREKEWAIIKERIYKTIPDKTIKRPVNSKIMGKIHDMVYNNYYFNRLMDACIILNTIIFMLYYHRSSI